MGGRVALERRHSNAIAAPKRRLSSARAPLQRSPNDVVLVLGGAVLCAAMQRSAVLCSVVWWRGGVRREAAPVPVLPTQGGDVGQPTRNSGHAS